MSSGIRLGLAAAVMASMFSAPAPATTIFSTLDGSGKYDGSSAWNVGPPPGNPSYITASGFVSSGNYSLEQIDLGLSNIWNTNSANVSLWTDVSGAPGTMLGSWSVSNQPSFGSTDSTLATIAGISGIDLSAGAEYFLVVAPGASDTWDTWNQSTVSTGDLLYSTDGGATWGTNGPGQPLGAFDIIGSAANGVPEPITISLFGAGLAGAAAMRRRKK